MPVGTSRGLSAPRDGQGRGHCDTAVVRARARGTAPMGLRTLSHGAIPGGAAPAAPTRRTRGAPRGHPDTVGPSRAPCGEGGGRHTLSDPVYTSLFSVPSLLSHHGALIGQGGAGEGGGRPRLDKLSEQRYASHRVGRASRSPGGPESASKPSAA